ncbi:MAG: hypothetical protein WC517_00440 [Patescibacteria group bacterium]
MFAVVVFAFVCAVVIDEFQAGVFDMPFGRNGKAALAANKQILEQKADIKPLFTGLAVVAQSDLVEIKKFLGNHRRVAAFVQFAPISEVAVIEWIGDHPLHSRNRQLFVFVDANQAKRKHFLLNLGERVFAAGEFRQNLLHLGKIFGVGDYIVGF